MIAFFIKDLDVRGGTHKQFLELLDYISAQHEDFFIITNQVDFDKTYPGFRKYADKITEIGDVTWENKWRQARKMRDLVRRADVINVHDGGFEFAYMAFRGKQVIVQINDLPVWFKQGVNKDFKIGKRGIVKAWWIRLQYWFFVDCITVNVSKNAERVKQQLGKDATVLYCGITPVKITHDNAETFTRFRQRRIQLLSSGVFYPYRNYETLVSATELLQERGVDVTLNIFGSFRYSPEYHKKIQLLIEEKHLAGVKILGEIGEAEYMRLHKESDLFCFVNVDQSWGLAVFEAMSAGVPVVVSNSVGATELLHDGTDALLVDPKNAAQIADAILTLMTGEQKYCDMQKNGLELVKEYSWENAYCKPMLDILRCYSSK